MRGPLKNNRQLESQYSSLLVGWDADAGRLGEFVANYIIRKLAGYFVYEIDPLEYFALGGVTIEDDLVQFPESKFYLCPQYNLVVFKSAPPTFESYKFLNKLLDIAEKHYKIKQVYSVGGIVSLNPHSKPRQLLGTFSSLEVKQSLESYDLETDVNYETPPGQKPTLNAFLLWLARKRNLIGINLWIPVPFYLMSVDDPKSQKMVLEFLNQRFKLGIDLREFDDAILRQNTRLNEARSLYPEIDDYLAKLESNLRLSEDENVKLVKQIEEFLMAKRE